MFLPRYSVKPKLIKALVRIEAARSAVEKLPITPALLKSLRETARLRSTHYSTQIEGNRLSEREVGDVYKKKKMEPGKERDELEVKGYFESLKMVESLAAQKNLVWDEMLIRKVHASLMGGGKKAARPTPYRDGQNVIRNSRDGRMAYLPPQAKDVPKLMNELVEWLNQEEQNELPCPLLSGIVHYKIATIHPYYDGNGRLARLLVSLAMRRGGHGLKGIYSLEEYYAADLQAYYRAITVGPSHNYYEGRRDSDISAWLEYFCAGVVNSFEKVKDLAESEASRGLKDASPLIRKLDARQREALALFADSDTIQSGDLAKLFKLKERSARLLCQQWFESGFFALGESSRKKRSYRLGPLWRQLASGIRV